MVGCELPQYAQPLKYETLLCQSAAEYPTGTVESGVVSSSHIFSARMAVDSAICLALTRFCLLLLLLVSLRHSLHVAPYISSIANSLPHTLQARSVYFAPHTLQLTRFVSYGTSQPHCLHIFVVLIACHRHYVRHYVKHVIVVIHNGLQLLLFCEVRFAT